MARRAHSPIEVIEQVDDLKERARYARTNRQPLRLHNGLEYQLVINALDHLRHMVAISNALEKEV